MSIWNLQELSQLNVALKEYRIELVVDKSALNFSPLSVSEN
jgi:hypothetical protein